MAALGSLRKLSTLTLGGELGGNDELRVTRSGANKLAELLPEAEIYLPASVIEDVEEAEAAEAAGEVDAPSRDKQPKLRPPRERLPPKKAAAPSGQWHDEEDEEDVGRPPPTPAPQRRPSP